MEMMTRPFASRSACCFRRPLVQILLWAALCRMFVHWWPVAMPVQIRLCCLLIHFNACVHGPSRVLAIHALANKTIMRAELPHGNLIFRQNKNCPREGGGGQP